MSKKAMKVAIAEAQDGLDPLTGEALSDDPTLVDTDRLEPKAEGGTYGERSNVRILTPRSHMERHGNLRDRETALEELKSVFDDRVQMMKFQLKVQNQIGAYKRRTDQPHPETLAFLEAQLEPIEQRLGQIDRSLAKLLKASPDPLVKSALGVAGLGPITISALSVYVDFHKLVCQRCRKAPGTGEAEKGIEPGRDHRCRCEGPVALVSATATPSALWKYVGLHCASHERYEKGVAGGGNKTLRTVLYNAACAMMKNRDSKYREVYDRTKARLEASEKIVTSRNTQGKLVEVAWKNAKPCHRHGAALRAIVKHLLADYWLVGRTLAGLPTVHLYAEAQLGHTHIIQPAERGWIY
jgi:hypothetical protein